MKLTPSSAARRSTRTASSRSAGGPQTPLPVKRIAPYPRRLTVRSPPRVKVPDAWAGAWVVTSPTVREPAKTGHVRVASWPGGLAHHCSIALHLSGGGRDGRPAAPGVQAHRLLGSHRHGSAALRAGRRLGNALGHAARLRPA